MERIICKETMVRSYITRNSDGIMETVTRQTPCDSDKWGYEITVPVVGPSHAGAGDTVVRMVKRTADRPFCANGHPRGGA